MPDTLGLLGLSCGMTGFIGLSNYERRHSSHTQYQDRADTSENGGSEIRIFVTKGKDWSWLWNRN